MASTKELDELKPKVHEAVQSLVGFTDSTIVSCALNCLGENDRQKTADNLSQLLEATQASHLADKVHSLYDDFRSSSRKRRKRELDEDGNKKRRFMENDDTDVGGMQNQASIPKPLPNIIPPGSGLTQDKIAEMMANAQKMIQERKAQLKAVMATPPPPAQNMPVKMPNSMVVTGSQGSVAEAGGEKERRAAELQATIAARLKGLAGQLPPPLMGTMATPAAGAPMGPLASIKGGQAQPLARPSPLILNAEGKTIDAKTGEAIQLTTYAPTLKANIRAKRREQFKGLIERPPEEISDSQYFDPRVSIKGQQRQKRGFRFHTKGKFEQQASRLRAKAQLERLQSEIASAAKKTGIASAAKIATITPKKEIKEGEVPDMEWWDTFIVKGGSYSVAGEQEIPVNLLEGVTNLVEHPIQIAPPVETPEEGAVPVYLTKAERKKLRRQNRNEAQKEVQEKIRLGLAPPMEPKVRMANLMRVLGTEAVQDPTKVEAHVRAQMAKRQRAHEENNAARKLTVEQRKEKKINKLKENTDDGVHVSVYRIRDLSDASHKFKVEQNCNQLYMTGMTVLYKDCNVVVVEGGPKQQRKYRRLMLHRIKWEEAKGRSKDNDDSDDEDHVDKTNKCVLVWEGMVKTRACGEMKFRACPTETFAREQMKKLGVQHYWDLAYSGTVLEGAIEDDV